MVDALDSKSNGSNTVSVQVRPQAPLANLVGHVLNFLININSRNGIDFFVYKERDEFMVRVIKKEIEIEESLKKKIEFICSFCNTTPIIENGSLRIIERTNLAYVEPHRIIIKGINFLAFNYETCIYVESLENKILIKDLESYIKSI